jgi:hypothetical protein
VLSRRACSRYASLPPMARILPVPRGAWGGVGTLTAADGPPDHALTGAFP